MRVDCAATSQEALELVRNHAYDLALCDVNLSNGNSGQSGRETASQIVAASHRGSKPEVIFMTGDLVEDNGGAAHVRQLQKPFRISEVLVALREALYPGTIAKYSN
jgi:CheY-like chemotaxis protein